MGRTEGLLPKRLPSDPLPLAASWLRDARRAPSETCPDGMVLATTGADGVPDARVVLCKHWVSDPGFVVFGTSYESPKAADLDAGRGAAAVLHWDSLGRQVRIVGLARRSPADESDALFAARAVPGRIGIWAGGQSETVADRATAEAAMAAAAARFGVAWPFAPRVAEPVRPIARPPFWGGYRLWIQRIELWLEGTGHVHDRGVWHRTLAPVGEAFTPGPWSGRRLRP